MKKIIALLLAVVMTFSLGTVAFATDAGADETTTSASTENDDTTAPEENDGVADDETKEEAPAGELDWLLDLPFWTVGPALKFAKIALKLVKVYVKLAMIFGIIDKDEITGQIMDMIQDAMAQQNGAAESTTQAPATEPETSEAA